jgi:hypothetical protein
MSISKSPWQRVVRRLERAVAAPVTGRERSWATRLGAAATELAEALRAHLRDSEEPGGPFFEVDLTRPSFVRQVDHLRREVTDLLALASHLQEDGRSAAQAFTFPDGPGPLGAAGIPDFGRLRCQAQQLLRSIERLQEQETSLVLESVTTDIGVGD